MHTLIFPLPNIAEIHKFTYLKKRVYLHVYSDCFYIYAKPEIYVVCIEKYFWRE